MPVASVPRYEFDESTTRLYRLTDADQVVFFPWPTMKAVQHRNDGRRSRARVTLDVRDAGAHPALARYLAGIPAEGTALAARFPERHWDVLVLAARCGAPALDLLRANPALGFMLATNGDFHRVHLTTPMTAARLLLGLGRKQREILDWLEFPATDSTRRIVRKIEDRAITVAALRALRGALGRAECRKQLAHLARITKPVVHLAGMGHCELVSPALLRAVADGSVRRPAAVVRLLDDTVRMWRRARPGVPLPVFHGVRRLTEEHDRLAALDWKALTPVKGDFPDPPVPGTDAIIPITSIEMLHDEGRTQDNCVASYGLRIAHRCLFVYRVVSPTRATLSIVKRAGQWRIDQLEAWGNTAAPRETHRAVQAWLARAQRDVPP